MNLFSWMTGKKPYLGVDIGKTSIKCVQLEPSGKGWVLKHASLVELEREGPQANGESHTKLSGLFSEKAFLKAKLATLLSGQDVTLRYLSLPKMSSSELGEAIRWEAKKYTSASLDTFVIDHLVVGEHETHDVKKIEVILAMVEKVLVQKKIREFNQVGAKLDALDVNHLVLLNSFRRHRSLDPGVNFVFVDIGAGKMDIGIVKGETLRFTRSVPMGGENITRAISQNFNVGFVEAEKMKRDQGCLNRNLDSLDQHLSRLDQVIKNEVDRFIVEVQRSIDFYRAQFHENAVQHLLLVGGAVQMSGFLDYFASYFDVPVEIDDPFSGFIFDQEVSPELRRQAPRFASGIGLALREP